jgi:hypothetical protein
MAGISGLGTTFNLPNYVGELFNISPEDTPFLSAIGGLTGGVAVNSTIFQWSQYDLRDADSTRQRLEGADAPTAEGRVRAAASNVLEIHQEQVSVTYTKQAATNQFAGTAPFVGGSNAVTDELAWQLQQEFKQIARDVEKSFISGTYQLPANNSTARQTRGLLAAIETNAVALGDTVLDKLDVLDLMQEVWENGGIQESETRTILVNATLKRKLTSLFITSSSYSSYQETSRNVGGVNLQTIETDFGRCNIMLSRYVPTDTLIVASLEDCAPAFLEIPGKGHFFAEPLAKTGASEKVQVYGEIGLRYGNERKHGKITGAATGAGS